MQETVVSEDTIARLHLYRFLVQGYTYPESTHVERLFAGERWDELMAAAEALDLEAHQTIAALRDYVEQYADNVEALLTTLQIEYTYLFINAVPRVPAPPYESAYTGQGMLMGEPVSQVLQAYQEAGLTMHQDYDALPDHMAAELEFMFYLVQQEAIAEQSGEDEEAQGWRARQRRFLAEHLLRWGPSFQEKVAASARQPFYRLMATLTEATFRIEEQRPRMTAHN